VQSCSIQKIVVQTISKWTPPATFRSFFASPVAPLALSPPGSPEYRKSAPQACYGPHGSVGVPHVRPSVRGPKMMGEARQSPSFQTLPLFIRSEMKRDMARPFFASIPIADFKAKHRPPLVIPARISYYALLAKTTCAALRKESRMQTIKATDLDRKSGGAQPRDLQFPPLSNGSQNKHPSLTEGARTQNNFAALDHRTPFNRCQPRTLVRGSGFSNPRERSAI
jgi:hypothetical protein